MSANPVISVSAKLFLELSGSRYAQQRRHGELVRLVCDQMEKDRVAITLAEVVARTQPDGPAYSTVAPRSSKIGEYIRARIDEQRSNLAPRGQAQNDIAEGIRDPVLQAQVRERENTAKWLQKENTGLRALLRALSPGLDADGIIRGTVDVTAPVNPRLAKPAALEAPTELRAILLKLLDHLIGARQYREMRGRFTINGKIVLDGQEMATLRRCTGLTDEQWQGRYGTPTVKSTDHG